MMREPLSERMRGRWHGILPMLGVDSVFLRSKHGPCVFCGGTDRWRFDDKDGKGTWICSHCGAGDGIALVMKINGWDFRTAAERIEAVAGDVKPRAAKPKADAGRQLATMRRTWNAAYPIRKAVRSYLLSRGIDVAGPCDVRESSSHEMLALVRGADGIGCQVHRTLLTKDGHKAEVEQCRLFMPGLIAKGAAVRLMKHDGELGIAEGIETALSAAILFQIPVWAALNATLLKQWEPPVEAKRVVVFADNDANCAGQAAAYELARRLSSSVMVSVEMPEKSGSDWNDVLRERRPEAIQR